MPNQPDIDQEHLITAAEAVTLFGKSRAQIYRWITDEGIREVDHLPGRGRRGGTAVYRLSDFAAAASRRHAEKQQRAQHSPPATNT